MLFVKDEAVLKYEKKNNKTVVANEIPTCFSTKYFSRVY